MPGEAQMLGAAVVHSALSIANSIGAVLGGAVIAAGLGYLAPSWTGGGLGGLGLGLAMVNFAHDRERRVAPGASVAGRESRSTPSSRRPLLVGPT